MRRLVYVVSNPNRAFLSTTSYKVAEDFKKRGYTYNIKLVEVTEKMSKIEKKFIQKRIEKRGF